MTFSARLNDDGSWRGLGWDKSHAVRNPVVMVGAGNEFYWTRKEAMDAARAKAIELGHLPNTQRHGTPDGSLATETRKPGSL